MFNLWWYAVTEHADERERDRLRMEVESHVLRLEVTASPLAPEEFVPSWWKGDDEAAMSTRAAAAMLGGNRRSQEGLVART